VSFSLHFQIHNLKIFFITLTTPLPKSKSIPLHFKNLKILTHFLHPKPASFRPKRILLLMLFGLRAGQFFWGGAGGGATHGDEMKED
jgi:hypothetical protein